AGQYASYLPTLPAVLPALSTRPAPTALYTLSLHDALPISSRCTARRRPPPPAGSCARRTTTGPARRSSRHRPCGAPRGGCRRPRSEEHTSELQSRENLVCRLLLEKKKNHHTQIKKQVR